jgi:hypothetical protein
MLIRSSRYCASFAEASAACRCASASSAASESPLDFARRASICAAGLQFGLGAVRLKLELRLVEPDDFDLRLDLLSRLHLNR